MHLERPPSRALEIDRRDGVRSNFRRGMRITEPDTGAGGCDAGTRLGFFNSGAER